MKVNGNQDYLVRFSVNNNSLSEFLVSEDFDYDTVDLTLTLNKHEHCIF